MLQKWTTKDLTATWGKLVNATNAINIATMAVSISPTGTLYKMLEFLRI